jgi:hypothetical protein
LTGDELNPDSAGRAVSVFKIDRNSPHPYLMPGADPGEVSTIPTFNISAVRILRLERRQRTEASSSISKTRSPTISRTILPESEDALRYYQIFNCVVQLVTVGRNRAQGRTAHGVYNSPVGVANLIGHVHLLTGLNVSLPA